MIGNKSKNSSIKENPRWFSFFCFYVGLRKNNFMSNYISSKIWKESQCKVRKKHIWYLEDFQILKMSEFWCVIKRFKMLVTQVEENCTDFSYLYKLHLRSLFVIMMKMWFWDTRMWLGFPRKAELFLYRLPSKLWWECNTRGWERLKIRSLCNTCKRGAGKRSLQR